MEKNSKERLVTGAKKVGRVLSILALTTTVALANPLTASAYVASENIIGEEQTTVDRTEVKRNDAAVIEEYFTGVDYYGDPHVYVEQIAKAVELSDVLNAYNNYEVNQYSNTRIGEVINLDIDRMYSEYLSDYSDNHQDFCARNINQKPAIDAYLNFACGTLTESTKANIENAAFNALCNEGYQLSNYVRVRVYKDRIYAITRINGQVQLIELNIVDNDLLRDNFLALNNRYRLCVNNIAGRTNEYPNCFAYNGIDRETNESAWLSLGDDELKANLRDSINYQYANDVTVSVDPTRYYVWSQEDIEAMRFFRFTEQEINNAVKMSGTVTITNQLVK